MTRDDVRVRLARRMEYAHFGHLAHASPPVDLGLEPSDKVSGDERYFGWTLRELLATPHFNLNPDYFCESDDERERYLIDYWRAVWTGERNYALEERVKKAQAVEVRVKEVQAALDRDKDAKAAEAKVKAQKEHAQRHAKALKDQSADWLERYTERYGPPPAYRTKNFDNFNEETPAQVAAADAAAYFPYEGPSCEEPPLLNLVFAGPVGVGKTHLAVSMFPESIACGDWAEFITATKLIRKYREKVVKESVLMARYGDGLAIDKDDLDQGCNCLVIDDFGIETSRDTANIFCEILDRRISAGLRTVITTNCTKNELRQWLGERGFSRLMSRCKWVMLDGDDYRQRSSNVKSKMQISS